MRARTPRIVVAVAAAAALLGAGCGSSEPSKKKRAERYDGPVIDISARFDASGADAKAEERYLANAANARLQRIAAIVVAPAGDMAKTRANNDAVLALQKKNAKVFPVPSVHPADGQAALEEVNRVSAEGAKLLRLHQVEQRFDLADPAVHALVKHAGERGMSVMIEGSSYKDPATLSKVVDLAYKTPETRIVLARMGLTRFHDAALFASLRKEPGWPDTIYFDLAGTATLYRDSPYAEELGWVIRLFPDRVLFGSDWPLHNSIDAIEATERLGLSAGELSSVFYANAAKLFGW